MNSTALATQSPEEAASAVETAIMEVVGKRFDNTPEANEFRLLQRQATMLSSSTLVPKEFQGNAANCAIGLNIAKRLGADAFMVLQNIDIIHGRPSFRATFLIAMVNASGRFSPLKFKEEGQGDDFGCTAYATDIASREIVEGPKVNWEMVKAEGWLTKSGSKWKTMPQLMFRYRAAAFFARIYAPDITLGMHTSEEIHDTEDIRTANGRDVSAPSSVGKIAASNPLSRRGSSDLREELEEALKSTNTGEHTVDGMRDDPAKPRTIGGRTFINEVDERASLNFDIRETLQVAAITLPRFEGMAKRKGFLETTEMLSGGGLPIEKLRTIHANRVEIAELKTTQEEEGAE